MIIESIPVEVCFEEEDVEMFANITDYYPGDSGSMGSFNKSTGNLIDPGYPPTYPEIEFYLSYEPDGKMVDTSKLIDNKQWEQIYDYVIEQFLDK